MEFRGTKGKWKYYKAINCNRNKQIISTIDGRGLFISGYHSNPNENEANALLISKAPEILKMLKSNLLVLQNTLSYLKNIEQYTPAYDKEKFKVNLKLIESEINSTKQLIKQATEL